MYDDKGQFTCYPKLNMGDKKQNVCLYVMRTDKCI
jgi:hypothetical protein